MQPVRVTQSIEGFVLILLFQEFIPSSKIALILNDGKFSASQITNQTQIVFMDEWTSKSLSCEDAKRIIQGR